MPQTLNISLEKILNAAKCAKEKMVDFVPFYDYNRTQSNMASLQGSSIQGATITLGISLKINLSQTFSLSQTTMENAIVTLQHIIGFTDMQNPVDFFPANLKNIKPRRCMGSTLGSGAARSSRAARQLVWLQHSGAAA
ncbi:hypothetical protein UY3_03087 [Chelonia mydas]|uniref:Uncharacterized protein n=1 Tax=Chelonia mydas TaxID=8469 RepID=M7C5E9_CHEMY|nr:hypothetical protein UY3_03087 [Chelonia mydas]